MPIPLCYPKATGASWRKLNKVDIPTTPKSTNSQDHRNVEQMNGFEKATLRWTKAAVFMAALAAFFVCLQWWEMKKGGADTHDLAVSAGNQADRTKDLADRMKEQAEGTKIIADQAVVQADANKRLAQNAVDSLINAKQSFRDEQRAWVGVQGTADSKGFTETEPWKVTIVFFNSGRTPARDVHVSGMYITSPTPLAGPSSQQVAMLKFSPGHSIAPQGYYRQNIGNGVSAEGSRPEQIFGVNVLVSQFSQIKSKQLFLYYYGILSYEDNSDHSHQTQYCVYLANPDTKESGMCDSFNDLD